MRPLTCPAYSARDVIKLCAESILDTNLAGRLSQAAAKIEEVEAEYIDLAKKQSLFSVPPAGVVGGVTAAEMKRVYKGTFAKSKSTRDIYDEIKKLPPNDICPLCGQRTVGTLDHYLAQSLHPALAITPANLLPACGDCNKAKLDSQPESANEQTLHPYFDFVDDETWLLATVEERSPAALLFRAHPPASWPTVKQSRVRFHFNKFRLGALYASHSAVELNNIRYGLQRIAQRGTADDVRAELLSRAESSMKAQRNSWQAAMYKALGASDWFCSSGFN